MKNLPTIIAIVFPILISCGNRAETASHTSPIQDNIALYIKKYANDPASYEAIGTSILDTIYFFELAKKRADELDGDRARALASIKSEDKDVATYKKFGIYDSESKKRYVAMKNIYDSAIAEADSSTVDLKHRSDSIAASVNNNPVCAILGTHKCRIKNGFGALSLIDYYFVTNAEGRLLFFTTNKAELPEYPNIYGDAKPIDLD